MSDNALNNSRIAKNTGILYLRLLFAMLISLYTSRAILNSLGVEDFGIYNVVGGLITMFSAISSSMAAATQRFITFEIGRKDSEQLSKVYSTAILIHFGIAFVVFLLIETAGVWFLSHKMVIPSERMDAAYWVLHLSSLSIVMQIMNIPNNAMVIAYEKMKIFAYISILDVTGKLLIALSLSLIASDRLKVYAVLMFLLSVIIPLLYIIYAKHAFKNINLSWTLDELLLKRMLSFASLSFIGDLAVIGYNQGLNILLNIFFGPVVNAARGIAVQVQGAIGSFASNFQMALNPQITKSYATGNFSYMRQLVCASSKYSFFLMSFLSVPILIETEQLLSWWLGVVPEYTASFIRLILLVTIVMSLANPITVSIHATGIIRTYQMVIGAMQLTIMPISYVILIFFNAPPESVFLVNLLVVLVTLTVRIYIVKAKIQLSFTQYFKEVIRPIVSVSILASVIPLILYRLMPSGISRVFVISIVSIIVMTLCIYTVGLNNSEKNILLKKIQEWKYR